jgi:kinesin family member 22
LIIQTIKYLFEKNFSEISFSFYEIYGTKINDLIDVKNLKELQIKEDKNKNVFIQNLSEKKISSFREFSEIYLKSQKLRKVGSNGLNSSSSRSHSFMVFKVKSKDFNCKLNLIDLAGSENNKKTGNTGMRMTESVHINSHLMHLKSVIESLANNDGKYINYRNSKLTMCLKDSLGGNSHCFIIGNVSFCKSNFNDCLNTLNFVMMGRKIINNPIQNEIKQVIFEPILMPPPPEIQEIQNEEMIQVEMVQEMDIHLITELTPHTKYNYSKNLLELGKKFEGSKPEISLRHYKDAQKILGSENLLKKIEKLEKKTKKKLEFDPTTFRDLPSIPSNDEPPIIVKVLKSRNSKENLKSIQFLRSENDSKNLVENSRLILRDKSSNEILSKLREKKQNENVETTEVLEVSFEVKLVQFINKADKNELKKLNLIGDKNADKIIATRPFESIDNLVELSWSHEKIRNFVKKNKSFF